MKIDRKIAVFIAALVMIPLAAVGLSGCVPSSSTTPATGGTANSRTDTPKPSESATPVTVGAVVKAGAALPDGFRAYKMPDQSLVAVSQDQPLPPAVRADLQNIVQTAITPSSDVNAPRVEVNQTRTFIDETFAGTGKYVIVIMQTAVWDPATRTNKYRWAALDTAPGMPANINSGNESDVQSRIQASIDSTGQADRYEIFVHN